MILQFLWNAIRNFFSWFVTPTLQAVVTTAVADRAIELIQEAAQPVTD